MRLKVKLKEDNMHIKVGFGEIYQISDGGYERGYAEGEKVGYLNGYTEGETKGKEEGYNEGFADGEKSVDNYLLYAVVANFSNLNLFGKADVVINMPYLMNASGMFRPNTGVMFGNDALNRTVEHLTINSKSKNITNATQMFYFAEPWDAKTALKHITLNMDTSKVISFQYMFNGCSLLETVDGTPLDFSSAVDSTATLMSAAPKVSYIRFAPNTIKCNLNVSGSGVLTDESVQSIIDGLADLTGQASKKVTFHSNILAKLTEEQLANIVAKNWTF